jgi:hypothetical protein
MHRNARNSHAWPCAHRIRQFGLRYYATGRDTLPGAQSYMQSVVVDDMGRPVVAWLEGDSPRLLHVHRWKGTSFEPLGDSPLSAYGGTGSVAGASLAMDVCGRVAIAFTEAEAQASDQAIQVYRYFD